MLFYARVRKRFVCPFGLYYLANTAGIGRIESKNWIIDIEFGSGNE